MTWALRQRAKGNHLQATGGGLLSCFLSPSKGSIGQSLATLSKLCSASFQRTVGEIPLPGPYPCPQQPFQGHAAIPDQTVRQEIERLGSMAPKDILVSQSISFLGWPWHSWKVVVHGKEGERCIVEGTVAQDICVLLRNRIPLI